MACFGGSQCGFDRFVITHLTDEYDVGILSQRAAKSFGEGARINVDFTLRYKRLLVAMEKLNRILDGHDMPAARTVDAINHRREGCGLSGTGCACNQDQSAPFL